jgi:predicted RecB family nuclease
MKASVMEGDTHSCRPCEEPRMRTHDGSILHAASDLNTFLGCAHAAALNLQRLRDPSSLPEPVGADETMALVQDAGHAHEADYLESLKKTCEVYEISSSGSLSDRANATIDAMRSGAPVIYQAAFLAPPWHGFADFLRRVEQPSGLGPWSYEVVDTKLARSPKPSHVLQLGLYSDLVAGVQGARPRAAHLVLGDGREALFRTVEFAHTLRAAQDRYLEFIATGAEGSRAEPCNACPCAAGASTARRSGRPPITFRGWQASSAARSRSCGPPVRIPLPRSRHLPPGTRIPKLAPVTFERLRAQAALQVARRTGPPTVEPLPVEPNRGFARLPKPSPHDLFFDLEGDPLHPDGLEYLWGVHYRDADGNARFWHRWAHDREAERAAFEAAVDWFTEHLARHPDAHIYHYAAYEVSVLRRLSTAFASREAAVDELLHGEKFVDLYAITRAAVRTSEPDLSLKTLEVFFAEARSDAVTKADQSIVHYHRWRETGAESLLDGILDYNRVDCENTERLRDWLVRLRPDLPWWTRTAAVPETEPDPERAARAAAREALRAAVLRDALRLSPRGRELMAYLVDFHTREKKPAQWAVFDRCAGDEADWIDDAECIGGIAPASRDWQRAEKRSTVATYRYPEQDFKLREGNSVVHAPSMAPMGTIFAIDRERGRVEVKRGNRAEGPFPESGALIPGWPIRTDVLEDAVGRVARHLAEGGRERYQAIVDLIERNPPRLAGWSGGSLVRPGENLIEAATRRALALDHSMLFIQGPPGTGKTYASAHVIVALMRAGKRVGVSSNSHKAINNLLAKVEDIAAEQGLRFSGAKKAAATDPDSYLNGAVIEDVTNNMISRRAASTWSAAPRGCLPARRWTSVSTTCSSTRRVRSRSATWWRWVPPRGT